MPHRAPLLRQLDLYLEAHPEDAARTMPIVELVRNEPRCLHRDCFPGHVTASAWIVTSDRRVSLLTLHKKLGRWLQLGGHADGHALVHEVALREAREESGLAQLTLVTGARGLVPLDVDVHAIPMFKDEPGHWHHDVRYLLIAGPDQQIARSAESEDLRWFRDAELPHVVSEESVLRMWRRARTMLG